MVPRELCVLYKEKEESIQHLLLGERHGICVKNGQLY